MGPIDLSFEEGRIYGLIGENGAGKSTLIRIVMGLSKPTSGTVELMGKRGSAGLRNARSNIGYVPDSSASHPLLNAAGNLKACCLEWGLDQRQIPRILDMIGLAVAGNKRVRSFSLGMRKRLDLRIALLGQPRMLVLDEPTKHTGRRMATRGAIASCRAGRCGDFCHARPMSRQKVDCLCDLPP